MTNPFLSSDFDQTYNKLNNEYHGHVYDTNDGSSNKISSSKSKFITISKLQRMLRKTYKTLPKLQNICLTGGITKINKYRWFWYVDIDDPKHKSLSMSLDVPHRVFAHLPFKLQVGDSVDAIGSLSLSKRSQNGLYVHQLMPAGLSQDYLKLVQTKKYLAENGYFNPEHKKKIPKFPRRIAVITSSEGAVIRDIIEQTRIRDKAIQIVLFPTSLDKPTMIANQIKRADQKDFDTIIVGRGGGSKKDLQPFNDKDLAIEVYQCRTPIISSVGHGIDKTLIDYVSDDSVVTPTAAAVDASPDIPKLIQQLRNLSSSFATVAKDKLQVATNAIQAIQQEPVYTQPKQQFIEPLYNQVNLYQKNIRFITYKVIQQKKAELNDINIELQQSSPQQVISQYQLELQDYQRKLTQLTNKKLSVSQQALFNAEHKVELKSPKTKLKDSQSKIKIISDNLTNKVKSIVQLQNSKAKSSIHLFKSLDPMQMMKRGYSYTTARHHIINNIKQLRIGDNVKIHTLGGNVIATVQKINREENNNGRR